MFFIMLSTAATLHKVGKTDISTAAEAAKALRPIAGQAAELLFSVGVVAAGFLAVPVMTAGAAFDLCQTLEWKHGLQRELTEAKSFYGAIVAFTAVAVCMNFLHINPMKALVYAGIVQGISTPLLTLMIMLINNNRKIMGVWVNGRGMNVLGWLTTIAMFLAAIGLLVAWIW
jgi:Mn2+/Fe2+ NRAMP family transporter